MAHGFLSVQKFPLRLRISMSGKNPSTRKFSAFSAPWYKHSITSLVPVEGKIFNKAAQSLHPKCRPSDYRRRGISTDWLEAPWKPNVSMCLHFVHNGHASFFSQSMYTQQRRDSGRNAPSGDQLFFLPRKNC